MALSGFLSALEDGGRLTVPSSPALQDPAALAADDGALDARLEALAGRVRGDLAHRPPPLSLPVARWAACVAWNACQALAHRALPVDDVARALEAPCPAPPSPSTALSADLVLSILPDLLALARGLAFDHPDPDPARALLVRLARAWPLSSVGADLGPGPFDVGAFVDDASLRALYVDRILARADLSRLGDPRVDEAAREALGARPDLCPAVARALGVELGAQEVLA